MLALNMAIVSINRILTTQDRIVLEQEYQDIINNLSLGNIESDYELTALYTEYRNDELHFFKKTARRRSKTLQ
ncbi:MAG: hypothetical protein IKN30_01870 [Synergistaceae bacterium]|nr:hypothetical protein [Synergistaceae bacterium]